MHACLLYTAHVSNLLRFYVFYIFECMQWMLKQGFSRIPIPFKRETAKMRVARPSSSTDTSTALSARPPLESPAKARQLTNTRTSASARGPRAAPTDVVPQWAPPPSNKLVDDKLNNVLSKLARRCDALAGTFHIEVARLEEASAREKKAAARARLQADAMHFATIEQREVMLQLQQEVDDAFNVSQKKKSKSQAWMGESEVRDVCQHRYVLEAARACQRNEEATAVAVDAARLELQSTLREYDLQTAIKEERQKLIYMRQQEGKEILRQKKASARRLSAIKSNAQSNEEAQLALERNAAERQRAIQAGIARRKAVQKEADERAAKRLAEWHEQQLSEHHVAAMARTSREETRQLDSARDFARRKAMVAEAAEAILRRVTVDLERLQKRAELIHEQITEEKEQEVESSKTLVSIGAIERMSGDEIRDELVSRNVLKSGQYGMRRQDMIRSLLDAVAADEARAAAERAAKAKEKKPPPPEIAEAMQVAERRHAIALKHYDVAKEAAAGAARAFVIAKRRQHEAPAAAASASPPVTKG